MWYLFLLLLFFIILWFYFSPSPPKSSPITNYIKNPSPDFRPSLFLTTRPPPPPEPSPPSVIEQRVESYTSLRGHSGESQSLLSEAWSMTNPTSFMQLISRMLGHQTINMEEFWRPEPTPARTKLETLKGKVDENCPICLGDVDNIHVKLPDCGHYFCKECIVPWFERNNTCPICRKNY